MKKFDSIEPSVSLQHNNLKWMTPHRFFESTTTMEFIQKYGNYKLPSCEDDFHIEEFVILTFNLECFLNDEEAQTDKYKETNWKGFSFTTVWNQLMQNGKLTRWKKEDIMSRITSYFELHKTKWILSPGQAFKGRFIKKLNFTKRNSTTPIYNPSIQSYQVQTYQSQPRILQDTVIIPAYSGDFAPFQAKWQDIMDEIGKIVSHIHKKCEHQQSDDITVQFILSNIDPSESIFDLYCLCFCIANARSGSRPKVSLKKREAGNLT
jgi:hypothetical protein